jgi:HlyD family secretion protein
MMVTKERLTMRIHGRQARGLLLALAAATVFACGRPSASGAGYTTAAVTRGPVAQRVTAVGTLSAVVSVEVGSQVSGKIAALHVDFNSPVTKGQLIAEIDPTVYAATLRQAEGELASAEATAVLKRQNLERKKALAPQRAASQFDVDVATAELAQAEASVIVRRAAVESARANLSYCKITSPVDGTVISRKVDVGQTVVAAMTTPVLFTIAQDITAMHISAAVSEADVGQVHVGQSVEFGVDAFPDEVFTGGVAQVRRAPTTTSNVVTYETIIEVANPEQKLFPGMTAAVSILVAERPDALKVPNAALRVTPPQGVTFETPPPARLARNERLVYGLGTAPGTLRPIVCRIGISDGIETEVLDCLADGASVVTSAPTVAPTGGFRPPGGPPPAL